MSDKNLIKKRFSKSIGLYNENALVQKKMAQILMELVTGHFGADFKNVFEIGCGAGNLSQLICQNINYEQFWANDLVGESENFVKSISNDIIFCGGDIESLNLPQNLDLIISNATFQWVSDFEALLNKISCSLKKNGVLCFSTFGENNFKEIYAATGIGLDYLSFEHLKSLCERFFEVVEAKQERVELPFETPLDVLRHIKKTGTNGLSAKKWTKSDFVEFEKAYPKSHEACILTYHPIYFLLKKS